MRRINLGPAGVAAILLAAACGGGDSTPSTATPSGEASATASPSAASATPGTATATPSTRANPGETIPLLEAEPVEMPEGFVLYYYGGRVPIEGAIPSPILRARQTLDGLEIEDLSALAPTGGEPFTEALDFANGRFARGLCTAGYCGGYGEPSDDAQNVLFVSGDGGVSWQETTALPHGALISGFLEDGQILIGQPGDALNQTAWTTWPAGTPIDSPDPEAYPGYVDGELRWVQQDGSVLNDRGNVLLAAPILPTDRQYSAFIRTVSDVTIWIPLPRDAAGTGYISEVDPVGNLGRTVRWEGFDLDAIGRIDADRVLVRRYYPPAGGIGATYILDFRTGELSEVSGLRRSGDVDAYPIGLVLGDFGRVETAGDCLNVREGPLTSTATLGCFPDGVLLRLTDPAVTGDDGGAWLPVETPRRPSRLRQQRVSRALSGGG